MLGASECVLMSVTDVRDAYHILRLANESK